MFAARTWYLLLLACAVPLRPGTGGTPRAEDPHDLALALVSALPGDTVRVGVAWGAASRATGYRVSVAATQTNGTWSGLPANLAVTTLSTVFAGIAIPWDSVTFTATVESVDNLGPTGKTVSGTIKLRKRAGAPGPITWDTTVTVVGVLVQPNTATMTLGSSRTLCGFKTFASGHVALKSADRALCDSIYQRTVTPAERLVSLAEQQHEDGACWAWSSSAPLAVRSTPPAACSAATKVDALQLTMQRVNRAYQYAMWGTHDDSPVVSVSETGLVTCIRPGLGVVTATAADGRKQVWQVECRNPTPVYLTRTDATGARRRGGS